MTAQPLPPDFAKDARWLVQAVDPLAGLARLVRMDEEAYRQSSFLDDRMLGAKPEARLCALADVLGEARWVDRRAAHWIFHIGHVGSTLVARLLGELAEFLSIREPRSLRDLVQSSQRAEIAADVAALMARTFRPGQRALVKATSFVSEIAPMMVQPDGRALFLFASPRRYIEGILAGENSILELQALEQGRRERLAKRGIDLAGFGRSNAHLAAAAWVCEMTALETACDAMPAGAAMWADFDGMLRDMAGSLAQVTAHFGVQVPHDWLGEISSGPLMRQYSKAPEFDYSPDLRAQLLAGAGATHRAAIDDAINGLLRSGQPLIVRALGRAGGE
jgi:hypothetical protein